MYRQLALLMLLFATADQAAPRASIDATIRGTVQPLAAKLLVRTGESDWKVVARRTLAESDRRVRFDALEPGVYQLLVQGTEPTEQLATKIVLGRKDQRRIDIDVKPVSLSGRVTYGGTPIAALLILRHAEFHWRGGIAVAEDGTFRAPLWQRGQYSYEIRGPALTTGFRDVVDLTRAEPVAIDIPDGRVRGVVRQTNGGTPVARATVVLESDAMTRTTTDADGRFDFTGVKDGRYTLRVASPEHLDPEPVPVQINGANRQRELTIDLDRGRTLPLLVVDPQQAPVIDAVVYAVTGARVCSRTFTDGDGRTNVAAPTDGDAMIFVVPRTGAFGVHRVKKRDVDALRIQLPLASSSLLIRTRTSTGKEMPPFSLLMRYEGTVVLPEIADALASTQGLTLAKGEGADVVLERIPSGRYEFWPYRTAEEAETIASIADEVDAPIQIDVRAGDNKVAVQFATR